MIPYSNGLKWSQFCYLNESMEFAKLSDLYDQFWDTSIGWDVPVSRRLIRELKLRSAADDCLRQTTLDRLTFPFCTWPSSASVSIFLFTSLSFQLSFDQYSKLLFHILVFQVSFTVPSHENLEKDESLYSIGWMVWLGPFAFWGCEMRKRDARDTIPGLAEAHLRANISELVTNSGTSNLHPYVHNALLISTTPSLIR